MVAWVEIKLQMLNLWKGWSVVADGNEMEVCLLLLSGWMKTMACWLSFVRVLLCAALSRNVFFFKCEGTNCLYRIWMMGTTLCDCVCSFMMGKWRQSWNKMNGIFFLIDNFKTISDNNNLFVSPPQRGRPDGAVWYTHRLWFSFCFNFAAFRSQLNVMQRAKHCHSNSWHSVEPLRRNIKGKKSETQ